MDNIKMALIERVWGGMDWFDRDRDQRWALINMAVN
jgi:hypothetical protein